MTKPKFKVRRYHPPPLPKGHLRGCNSAGAAGPLIHVDPPAEPEDFGYSTQFAQKYAAYVARKKAAGKTPLPPDKYIQALQGRFQPAKEKPPRRRAPRKVQYSGYERWVAQQNGGA